MWADGILFESTGLYGQSELRRVDLRSGRVLAARPLTADRFGEGLALLNGRLYQLTWKEGVAYTYDARDELTSDGPSTFRARPGDTASLQLTTNRKFLF